MTFAILAGARTGMPREYNVEKLERANTSHASANFLLEIFSDILEILQSTRSTSK